jgi:hypothetical protein
MLMSTKPIDGDIASQLRTRGADLIAEMISEAAEETLHLEFKTLSESSGEKFTKEDRRVLARAICWMANADGGLIVVGVETRRIDNLDVATGKRLVRNPEKMRNRLVSSIPEMLSPQHQGVVVYSITEGDEGYLIIEVPHSDERPHYSNVHHQYFRRGSDGTRLLEHSEVRELMLATRQGALDIDCILRLGSSTGDLKVSLSIELSLRNAGRAPVVAPYVRMSGSPEWTNTPVEHLSWRRLANGDLGIYATRDLLLHVGDDMAVAQIPTGLDFRGTGQFEINAAINSVRQNGIHSFSMLPVRDMPPQGFTANDRSIKISGFYGAENALAKPFKFEIDKIKLLDLFCGQHSI